MKKFLTALLSVVLAVSMFALVGCDKKKSDMKLSTIIENIDLKNGFTASVDMRCESADFAGDISSAIKFALDGSDLKLDIENEITEGVEKSATKTYVRGNDVYVSEAGTTFEKSRLDESMDVTALLGAVDTTSDMSIGGNLIDSEVVFYEDGGKIEAKVDVFEIAAREIKKFRDVIDMMSVDTTVKQIYDKIDGDELIDKLFGDVKVKDAYAEFYNQLKDVPEDMLPPQLGLLPSDVEAFIKMLNTMAQLDLPEAKDSTLAEYAKTVISKYFDMTMFEIELKLNGGELLTEEQKEAMKQEAIKEIEAGKKELLPQLDELLASFEANTCIFTITASTEGVLEEISTDISIDEKLASLLGSMSKPMPFAAEPAASALAFRGKITFDYAAPQFVDVSKLEVKDTFGEASIRAVRSAAVAAILMDDEQYGDAESWYVSATVDESGEIVELNISVTAPEDPSPYTEKGTFVKTASGYEIYIHLTSL